MRKTVFCTRSLVELTARSRSVLNVLQRLERIQNETDPVTTRDEFEQTQLMRALNQLHDRGRLVFTNVDESTTDIFYIPSLEVRDKVFTATPGGAWTEKIVKRQRNSYRTSIGTLFRFPFEDGDGYLQAFITDWSPYPAAAALAVHKDHPSVRRVPRREGSYFTGKYVRNALTGDLMPVWIASWVKPEFGTGVVAVNPAHDRVDLNFARQVGLPIRFGLIRTTVTSDASTWPEPPVIKEGKTYRTGNWDGIGHDEALARYFEVLNKHGYAESYVDRAVSSSRIASFTRADSGPALLCMQCSSVRTADNVERCDVCEGACVRGVFENEELFWTVMALEPFDGVEILCPNAEIETTLLSMRLLFQDLFGRPFEPQKIYLMQDTEKTSKEVSAEIAALASIIAAPLDQLAVLRQPVLDQTQLFYQRHAKLVADFGPATPASAPLDKSLLRAKESLMRWNLAEAFAAVYKFQKELSAKPGDTIPGLLPGYFTLAFVMSGAEYPPQLRIADVWRDQS